MFHNFYTCPTLLCSRLFSMHHRHHNNNRFQKTTMDVIVAIVCALQLFQLLPPLASVSSSPSSSSSSSDHGPGKPSLQQVELLDGDASAVAKAAPGACSRLVKGGQTSVLAAGRLHDRFLLLTSDFFLFELHPDNYLKTANTLSAPSHRLLINTPPKHLSTRFPASFASFAADVARNIVYGFTLSLYFEFPDKREYRADYLAFVYLNQSATASVDRQYCLFAIDIHPDRPVYSFCSKSLSTVQAISHLPSVLLLAGYVRADEHPQMFCGPEMEEMAVFYSAEMMPAQKDDGGGGGGGSNSKSKKQKSEEPMPCFELEQCVRLQLLGDVSPEQREDRATPGRCTNFTGRRLSAGFYLTTSEVALIDGSTGTVHFMEDLITRRVFVERPLAQYIGCDVGPSWNIVFQKKHVIYGVAIFFVVQAAIGLFICYSLDLCGQQQHEQKMPVKKVKKGRRSKKERKRGSKSEALRKSSSFGAAGGGRKSKSFSPKKSSARSSSSSSSISRGSSKMSRQSADDISAEKSVSTSVSFSKRRSSVLEGTTEASVIKE